MSTVETPDVVTLPLTDIKPYWRNPRRIPPEAIAAVRTSLETYGYMQPIVVDRSNVIVVGHTRFYAMQEMGIVEAQVYVTDLPEDKAREYRLVDNRTGEMSQWDHGALVLELREFEQSLLDQFFPDVDLEISQIDGGLITSGDVEAATKKVLAIKELPTIHTTKIVCPSCFHSFDVRTDSLPGLSRADLESLAGTDDG